MTKAANIKVSACNTWAECYEAIEQIESDYRNIVGGLEAWYSGQQYWLTAAAAAKVKMLKDKARKLTDGEENFQ